jgi:hypothetical protein
MNNPIFVFEGVRAATLTASEGSASGYPITNLKDDRYATLWKSGGVTANQNLTIEFSAIKNVNSCLIANHNFASLGISALEVYSSADGEEWYLFSSIDSYPDPLSIRTPGDYTTDKYWKLVFVKSSPLNAPPQMGLLYVGMEAVMPLYNNLPERGLQCDPIIAESMSKLRYSTSMGLDRETWKLNFGRLNTQQSYDFMRLIRSVNGRQYPFWFYDVDGNWHFIRFKKNYLPLIGKGNVIFSVREIEFDEERVGIPMNLPGSHTV